MSTSDEGIVKAKLENYTTRSIHDKTVPILNTFLNYLMPDGVVKLREDILHYEGSWQLHNLAYSLVMSILFPSEYDLASRINSNIPSCSLFLSFFLYFLFFFNKYNNPTISACSWR